jgi:hypothetical protein
MINSQDLSRLSLWPATQNSLFDRRHSVSIPEDTARINSLLGEKLSQD